MLAVATTTGIPPIICTILLIATVIAFILGFAELLGLFALGWSGRTARFHTLVLAVILLVIYVLAC
jgi:hypothetical protein